MTAHRLHRSLVEVYLAGSGVRETKPVEHIIGHGTGLHHLLYTHETAQTLAVTDYLRSTVRGYTGNFLQLVGVGCCQIHLYQTLSYFTGLCIVSRGTEGDEASEDERGGRVEAVSAAEEALGWGRTVLGLLSLALAVMASASTYR